MYVINLDDRKINGTYGVSLFVDRNTAIYFDSFGIEYIPQEVLNKIKGKSNHSYNIFRIQENHSILCEFHCITFVEYMLEGKTLIDYSNFFSEWL